MENASSKTIHIALSTDDNYAKYCALTILSLKDSQTEFEKINVYIIFEQLCEYSKKILLDLEDDILQINFLSNIDKNKLKSLIPQNTTITPSSYYRLLLPELLADVEKILYLDSDIIVTKSLMQLWQENIDDYYIAGCLNIHWQNILKMKNAPNRKLYVNAGVLVINLKKWRENNIIEKFKIQIKNPNSKIIYNDQCILNNTFTDDEIKLLPIKWNLQSHKQGLGHKKAAIIHYIGIKPWILTDYTPFRNYYWKILRKSIWKKEANLLAYLINTLFIYKFILRRIKNFTKKYRP